jgi:hypothetical protein
MVVHLVDFNQTAIATLLAAKLHLPVRWSTLRMNAAFTMSAAIEAQGDLIRA